MAPASPIARPGLAGPCGMGVPHLAGVHVTQRRQQQPHPQRRREMCVCAARQDEGSLSRLEMEVPSDQRPINELKQLKASVLFSWATLDLPEYSKRLALLWAGVFAAVGGPIAYGSFDPLSQPAEFFLSACTGSLLVVAVTSLRIYLGWKYVADRLMTATLEYEETGWYDGQYFVKPPEILTRDRLVGSYEVRPVMARLRRTLQATGVGLLTTAVALLVATKTGGESPYDSSRLQPAQIMADGTPIYSSKVSSAQALLSDDEAAEAEAAALGDVPGYCRDRYFKAAAGGEDVCRRLLER